MRVFIITFLQDWEFLSYPHFRLTATVGLDFVPKLMKSKQVTRLPARADAALNLKTWVPNAAGSCPYYYMLDAKPEETRSS